MKYEHCASAINDQRLKFSNDILDELKRFALFLQELEALENTVDSVPIQILKRGASDLRVDAREHRISQVAHDGGAGLGPFACHALLGEGLARVSALFAGSLRLVLGVGFFSEEVGGFRTLLAYLLGRLLLVRTRDSVVLRELSQGLAVALESGLEVLVLTLNLRVLVLNRVLRLLAVFQLVLRLLHVPLDVGEEQVLVQGVHFSERRLAIIHRSWSTTRQRLCALLFGGFACEHEVLVGRDFAKDCFVLGFDGLALLAQFFAFVLKGVLLVAEGVVFVL